MGEVKFNPVLVARRCLRGLRIIDHLLIPCVNDHIFIVQQHTVGVATAETNNSPRYSPRVELPFALLLCLLYVHQTPEKSDVPNLWEIYVNDFIRCAPLPAAVRHKTVTKKQSALITSAHRSCRAFNA